MENEIILYSSDKAAQPKTVSGWVTSKGQFFMQENMARYAGCTHINCECGGIATKGWTKCESCREKLALERYKSYPFKKWHGSQPVYDNNSDRYFFSFDEIDDYLEESELNPEDLQLVICEPNYARKIDSGYWEESLPEDGDIPKELQKKIYELNELITTLPPLSYSPSKIRTNYNPGI